MYEQEPASPEQPVSPEEYSVIGGGWGFLIDGDIVHKTTPLGVFDANAIGNHAERDWCWVKHMDYGISDIPVSRLQQIQSQEAAPSTTEEE